MRNLKNKCSFRRVSPLFSLFFRPFQGFMYLIINNITEDKQCKEKIEIKTTVNIH